MTSESTWHGARDNNITIADMHRFAVGSFFKLSVQCDLRPVSKNCRRTLRILDPLIGQWEIALDHRSNGQGEHVAFTRR